MSLPAWSLGACEKKKKKIYADTKTSDPEAVNNCYPCAAYKVLEGMLVSFLRCNCNE